MIPVSTLHFGNTSTHTKSSACTCFYDVRHPLKEASVCCVLCVHVRVTGLARAPSCTVKLQELPMSILVFTFTLNCDSVWYFREWMVNLALCHS